MKKLSLLFWFLILFAVSASAYYSTTYNVLTSEFDYVIGLYNGTHMVLEDNTDCDDCNISADYFKGSLDCTDITGGSDSDFCADASGGGGAGMFFTDGTYISPNRTNSDGVEIINATGFYINGVSIYNVFTEQDDAYTGVNATSDILIQIGSNISRGDLITPSNISWRDDGDYDGTNHSGETHAYIGNCSGKNCDIGWGNITGLLSTLDLNIGDDYDSDNNFSLDYHAEYTLTGFRKANDTDTDTTLGVNNENIINTSGELSLNWTTVDNRTDNRYYKKTEIDTLSETEAIWSVSLVEESEVPSLEQNPDNSTIDHDQLMNFAANEHFTWASVSTPLWNTINNDTPNWHSLQSSVGFGTGNETDPIAATYAINRTLDEIGDECNSSLISYIDAELNTKLENNSPMNISTLLVLTPPARCPSGTFMVYTNMTTAICISETVFTSFNFTDNLVLNLSDIARYVNDTSNISTYQNDIGNDCSAGDFAKGVDDDGTLDCDTPAGGGGGGGDNITDGTDYIKIEDNSATFYFNGANQFNVTDGIIRPITANDVDLGDADHRFKLAYFTTPYSYSGLYHLDDADTKLTFAEDSLDLRAGNVNMVGLYEYAAAQDIVIFNVGLADVDVNMRGDNTQNLFYLNAGSDKIGIGTKTPDKLLTVYGDALIEDAAGGNLYINRNDTSISSGNTVGIIYFSGNDGGTNLVGSQITATADATWSNNDYPTDLKFSTAPDGGTVTERMRIESAGQIGINTTSPAQTLTVQGTLNVTTSKNDSDLFVDSTGNVGIGTASPTEKLTLGKSSDESGNPVFKFYGNDSHGSMGTRYGSIGINNYGNFVLDADQAHYFTIDGTTVMITGKQNNYMPDNKYFGWGTAVDSRIVYDGTDTIWDLRHAGTGNLHILGGNVGIGTTSPTQLLHVEGNVNITGTLYGGSALNVGGGLNISNGNLYFSDGTNQSTASSYIIYMTCGENSALDTGSAEWSCGGNGETGQAVYVYDDITITHISLDCNTGTGAANVTIQVPQGTNSNCYVNSETTNDVAECDLEVDAGTWIRPLTVSDSGHSNCVMGWRMVTR